MKHLPFGKDWEEDILSLKHTHMLKLFKMVCIRLILCEKDLKEAKKEIEGLKKK